MVNAGRQFAAVAAIALVAALVQGGPGGFAPTTVLQALPALLLMLTLGGVMAWRLPGSTAPVRLDRSKPVSTNLQP